MSAGVWRAVEPINRIVPRIQDRRERNRRDRPFPPIEDEEEDDDTKSNTPSSRTGKRPEPSRRDPGDAEERKIDVVVAPWRHDRPGTKLPGGQVLPASTGSRAVH